MVEAGVQSVSTSQSVTALDQTRFNDYYSFCIPSLCLGQVRFCRSPFSKRMRLQTKTRPRLKRSIGQFRSWESKQASKPTQGERGGGGGRERERERQTDRQRLRQTETGRQEHRQAHTGTDISAQTGRDRHRQRQTGRGRQAETNRQTGRDRQADRDRGKKRKRKKKNNGHEQERTLRIQHDPGPNIADKI